MNFKDFIQSKEISWRNALKDGQGNLTPEGKIILADLRNFCNGTKSPFRNDTNETMRQIGRQEVFQRIVSFLEYDYSKLYELEEELIDE